MHDRRRPFHKLFLLLLTLIALHAPSLQAQFDPERAYKQSAEVRQHYPDPQVAYDTPGFAPGRKDFTSHEEMLAYVEALRRRSDTVRVRIVGELRSMVERSHKELSRHAERDVKLCRGGIREAEHLNVPLLGQIPIDIETRERGDSGAPVALVSPAENKVSAAFHELAAKIVAKLPVK